MVLDTVKENFCVNKLIATKKEILFVEGDMIVPDSKPDILNTICTSGIICVYKKETLDDKVRIDGNINTYISYLADDEKDKVRGINTSLDFSETIQVPNCKDGMECKLNTKLRDIECKVINGRKIGIKATIELEIKIYSSENIEIVNDIENTERIQMLKENLTVNSLVGTGETKIYAKDTININNGDNLAEILKANICICDKDVKISYNKILTKAEAEIKIMYLTEDNRIGIVDTKIPVVGFIDIQNVTEENICDINYEIRNIVIKPNPVEEHTIYIEMEIGVSADVYEEKQINLIQDMYSPCLNLEFDKKNIIICTDKKTIKETKQIRDKITVEGIENNTILDVDVNPVIQKETKLENRIRFEGELEITIIIENTGFQVETRIIKMPFDYTIENIDDSENINVNLDMEVTNKDFIIQDEGNITTNIDINMNSDLYRNTSMNIINQIQINGDREEQDYSIIIYIVKEGDNLWKIAKKFGSTVEDIARTNGIEDQNKIFPNQKLFIPHYTRVSMSSYE